MKAVILLLSSLFIIGWISDSFAQVRATKLESLSLKCQAYKVTGANFVVIPNLQNHSESEQSVFMEGQTLAYKAVLFQPKPNPSTPNLIPTLRVVMSLINKENHEVTRTFFDASMGRGEVQKGVWDVKTRTEVISDSLKCVVVTINNSKT
jgi:hypothetical protein